MPELQSSRSDSAEARPDRNKLFRKTIKQWMDAQGVTQARLARLIDRAPTWVSKYLSGLIDIDVETACRIVEALEHTVDQAVSLPTDPTEARLVRLFLTLPARQRKDLMNLLESMVDPTLPPLRPRGRE